MQKRHILPPSSFGGDRRWVVVAVQTTLHLGNSFLFQFPFPLFLLGSISSMCLRAALTSTDTKSAKSSLTWLSFFAWDLRAWKLCVKCLVKLTPAEASDGRRRRRCWRWSCRRRSGRRPSPSVAMSSVWRIRQLSEKKIKSFWCCYQVPSYLKSSEKNVG